MPTKSRSEIMDFYLKRGDEIRKKEGREPRLTDADPRDLLRMVELDRSPVMENDAEKTALEASMDPFWVGFEKQSSKASTVKDVASAALKKVKNMPRPKGRDLLSAGAGGAAVALPAYLKGKGSGREQGRKQGRRAAYRDISRTTAPTED